MQRHITTAERLHPQCGPQTVQQTPLPLTPGAFQRPAPKRRAGGVAGRQRKDPQERRASSAPWGVLSVRKY